MIMNQLNIEHIWKPKKKIKKYDNEPAKYWTYLKTKNKKNYDNEPAKYWTYLKTKNKQIIIMNQQNIEYILKPKTNKWC